MIFALILTLFIETIMLFILRYKDYRIYLLAILMNLITNLPLNFILTYYPFETYIGYFIVGIILEIFILFIESFFYLFYFKNYKKALKVSLLLNLTSFLIGLVFVFFLNFSLINDIYKTIKKD